MTDLKKHVMDFITGDTGITGWNPKDKLNDLGYDHLETIRILMDLEDNFGIDFPEEIYDKKCQITIKEIADYIVGHPDTGLPFL